MTLCLIFALWAFAAITPARAQTDFPNRSVKIVVPFPAGGPTDGMARIVADRLGTVLGQSIVIENKGGGAGGIGLPLNAAITTLAWTQVSLILLVIIGTVVVSEWVSAKVRHAII